MCRNRCDAVHWVVAGQREHSHDVDDTRRTNHGRWSPRFSAFRLGGVLQHHLVCLAPAIVLLRNVVSGIERFGRSTADKTGSDYAAKVFGFATFGRVYGAIICFSGVVNLSQPLIDATNHEIFHDNPIPINVILASLGFLFGTLLVVFVWVKGRDVPPAEPAMLEASERDCLIIREVEEPEDEY